MTDDREPEAIPESVLERWRRSMVESLAISETDPTSAVFATNEALVGYDDPTELDRLEDARAQIEEHRAKWVEAQVAARLIENARAQQDIELRRTNAESLRNFTIGWSVVVGLILLLSGASDVLLKTPLLSDAVILALIGGTTANAFGLYLVVVRNLFPQRDKSSNPIFPTRQQPTDRR